MTRELRKIVFTEGEVQDAAVGHCLRAKIPLPRSNIIGIDIADDPLATVILHYPPELTDDPTDVALTREEVAAALIRHCVEQRIPLPREAKKLLIVESRGLALMMNIDHGSKAKAAKRR